MQCDRLEEGQAVQTRQLETSIANATTNITTSIDNVGERVIAVETEQTRMNTVLDDLDGRVRSLEEGSARRASSAPASDRSRAVFLQAVSGQNYSDAVISGWPENTRALTLQPAVVTMLTQYDELTPTLLPPTRLRPKVLTVRFLFGYSSSSVEPQENVFIICMPVIASSSVVPSRECDAA